MRSCDDCQAQLLEYVYGLLEPEEIQALRAHVEQCANCRAALAQAEAQQHLLAVAAKSEFAALRFEAPAAGEAVAEIRQPRPEVVSLRWARWAVAAAVLLAVGWLGFWGRNHYVEYASQRDRVTAAQDRYRRLAHDDSQLAEAHQARLQETGKEQQESQSRLNELVGQQQKDLNEAFQKLQKDKMFLAVIAPRNIQPGAPNEIRVETRNLFNGFVAARLDAQVRDRAHDDEVVYESKNVLSAGQHALRLPADLPVKPNADLYLNVVATAQGQEVKLTERLALLKSMYVTHLATDKPMYQPGQTVYFRSLTLQRFNFKPPSEDFKLSFKVTDPRGTELYNHLGARLVDEKDKEILGPDGKPLRGIGVGQWEIPADQTGGEFTLTVSDTLNRFPPEKRKFLVNQYQPPRLDKELDFTRKSYGPGDEVVALGKVSLVENKDKPLANQEVKVTITVDGKPYGVDGKEAPAVPSLKLKTDAKGGVTIKFKLPAQIERGDASLAVEFTDGANHETKSLPIPVVLKKLLVDFYPEGGDLVAGVPNRVYFEVRSLLGKPAELKGQIVDPAGKPVAELQTLNDDKETGISHGRGVFEITPAADIEYSLKIASPAGIESKHALPKAKAGGVVLKIATGVTRTDEPITVVVNSAEKDRNLLVGAYCRGRMMAHWRGTAKQGQATEIKLEPDSEIGGVYRVTVFEERPKNEKERDLVPVAERLVYRRPAGQMQIDIQADKQVYVPGEKVTLTATGRDGKKQPLPAILMMAVVDKSVVALADEKTYRSMPTHFLVTSEVRRPEDLEHADVLLGTHEKAAQSLDLLLGTQGWRRFAEQNPEEFRKRQKEDADRLLVSIGQMAPGQGVQNPNANLEARRKVLEKYLPQIEAASIRRTRAETAFAQAQNDQDYVHKRNDLDQQIKQASISYVKSAKDLSDLKDNYRQFGFRALLGLAIGLLAVGIISMVLAIARGAEKARSYYGVGIGSVVLCGLMLLATFLISQPADDVLPITVQRPLPTDGKKPEAFVAEAQQGRVAEGRPEEKADDAKEVRHFQKGAANMPMPAAPAALIKKNVERAENRVIPAQEREQAKKELKHVVEKGEGLAHAADRKDRELPQADKRKMPADRRIMGGARARGGPRDMMADEIVGLAADEAQQTPEPFRVREYAHRHTHGDADLRSDFAETLYWHPVLVLPDGRAQVSFELSDSVTSFQVLAAGHTLDGRLGAVTTLISSRKPFTVEPKLPLEVTANDKIDVPLAVANDTAGERTIRVRAEGKGVNLLSGNGDEQLQLAADQRLRKLYRFQPNIVEGEAALRFSGSSEPFQPDNVLRTFKVVPEGFPILGSHSDVLETVAQSNVTLPETWLPGTLKCQVQVYPSTLADLQKGLESMLREPCGCFEQTSTSNYPNLLILNYLKESDQSKPDLEKQARRLLESGYQKLTSFECLNTGKNQREGYEWFGGTAPAHEALTAYGLLEFRDMAKVHDVDPAMIERTRQYLMSRKDGKGGFQRNTRALDSFGAAPEPITNAYIVWAITEGGKQDDIEKEMTALTAQAKDSADPYFLALVANSLINHGQADAALDLLKKLAKAQNKDGYLDGAQTSITRSGGRDLQIETTALAVLAWLKANRPEFNLNIRSSIQWIGQQRGGYGGFGSTQSTILALKALIAFTKANKKTAEAGTITMQVGGKNVKLDFPAGAQDALVLDVPEPEKLLKSGKNEVRLEITGKNVFPYTVAYSYQTLKPPSADKCPVSLKTSLNKTEAAEGEQVQLTAVVENKSGQGQGMAVAILGLPAGLTLPEDMQQLKDMARLRNDDKEPGLISAWELRGTREVVLYWRDLAPDKKIEVNLNLVCRVPGEYRGPASRAYLYYNADHKSWTEPLRINIQAKGE